jgi:juvenile hormone diol kinase
MLTEFQSKKWTHLFHIYDIQNSSFVTKEDFEIKAKNVAKLFNIAVDSTDYSNIHAHVMADWNHLQQEADTNNDGKISLDEWLKHGYTRISGDMYDTVKKEAGVIFTLFDTNGDGVINKDEYATLLKVWGVTDNEVDFACSKIGLDNDNGLSKEQFIGLLEQFHKSDDPTSPGNYFFGSFEKQ